MRKKNDSITSERAYTHAEPSAADVRLCLPRPNPPHLVRRRNSAQKRPWSLPLALSGERVEVPSFTTVVIAHLGKGLVFAADKVRSSAPSGAHM